jgi:plasmid replication initiation protein
MKKTIVVKERTGKPLAERYVSMSNALARSAQGLTLSEKRVVAMALAKTDTKSNSDKVRAQFREGWTVHLSADEYANEFGLTHDAAYLQLKSAADNLLKRQVRTMTQTIKGVKEVKTNWCGQCIYHHGEGWVEIAFTTQISPHLLDLKSKFTTYKLQQVSALRSVYSWRLFECLKSWGDKGRWSPDIEEFMHAMDAPPSLSDFGQVKRRIIDPALKELREKDNQLIDLVLKKAGRKVTGLVFTFQSNPQGQLPL